jgi:hypothetical protein
MITSALAGNDQNQGQLATLSLPLSTRAVIKRIELDYRQFRLDSRRAFAGILDSIAGNLAGKIPHDEFEIALHEVIPAEAFRVAVAANIIESPYGAQSAIPPLTLPLLDRLQRQYGHIFQIISLCDLVRHPETASDFIARDLTVDEVRNDLMTLMVKLDQAIVTFPYGPPPIGSVETASNSGGLAWSMVVPDPNEVPRKQDHEGSEVPPVDRLRRIHRRLGRSWDDREARTWLLFDKLKLADLIRENALKWSERELVRLAEEEDQGGSATSQDSPPSRSEPRRKPGPKPNLEVGRQVVAVVQAHTDWEADLDDVCEELDQAGAAAPKRRDGHPYRGWLDALDIADSSARDRVIKAIRVRGCLPRKCPRAVQGHDCRADRCDPADRGDHGQWRAQGGDPSTWPILRATQGLEDIWQVHYSAQPAKENINPPADFIANLEQPADEFAMIKLSAQGEGTYSVTNTRNGFTKTYKAGTAGGRKKP